MFGPHGLKSTEVADFKSKFKKKKKGDGAPIYPTTDSARERGRKVVGELDSIGGEP